MNISKYNKKYIIFIISAIITLQSTIEINIHVEDINSTSNTSLNDYTCEEGNKNVITAKHIFLLKFLAGILTVEIGPYILGSIGKTIEKL